MAVCIGVYVERDVFTYIIIFLKKRRLKERTFGVVFNSKATSIRMNLNYTFPKDAYYSKHLSDINIEKFTSSLAQKMK